MKRQQSERERLENDLHRLKQKRASMVRTLFVTHSFIKKTPTLSNLGTRNSRHEEGIREETEGNDSEDEQTEQDVVKAET